jgi:hypothetical protein
MSLGSPVPVAAAPCPTPTFNGSKETVTFSFTGGRKPGGRRWAARGSVAQTAGAGAWAETAVGAAPGTAWPGQPANRYIYAHRQWGMFASLLYARVGDAAYIHDYGSGRH